MYSFLENQNKKSRLILVRILKYFLQIEEGNTIINYISNSK